MKYSKEQLLDKVREKYHVEPEKVYNATGLYLKNGFRALFGYVVNDTYFADELSGDIYPVCDVSQLDNVDEYDD